VAAYAFVLNALVATALLASVSPAKSLSGLELCVSSLDTGHLFADQDGQDKATKRAAVHCQLCLQFAQPATLPIPTGVGLPLPIAVSLDTQPVTDVALPAQAPPNDHRPRGPPHLT
jgi:hypothetical protein